MEGAHRAAATPGGLQGRCVWGVVEGSNMGVAGRRDGGHGPRESESRVQGVDVGV